MIGAVTFDYWNTLVFEERGHLRGLRSDKWAGILEEAGYTAERETLGAVFDSTWQVMLERQVANDHISSEEAARIAVDSLGFAVPADVRAQLVDAFGDAANDAELHLTRNITDCLQTLKARGVKLGIVCDVGFTPSRILRAFLSKRDVLGLFDSWAFSDEVGVYKPSPVIFEYALSPLGVPPERTAHVGDLRRTDVAGAKGMGMTSVRYTGVWDDDTQPEPEADLVLDDHAKLPSILGL